MAKNKKPKKPYRPKPSGGGALLHVWRMKGHLTDKEIYFVADKALECFEDMKKKPDRFGYIQMVDIVNILSVVIAHTCTKKECERLHCENIHEWLTEIGHDNVAEKINEAHECLYQVGERFKRTGSYALDAHTIEVLEEVFQMYWEVYNEAPRGLMKEVILQRMNVHKRDSKGGMTLTHCNLTPYFIAEEKTWKFEEDQDGNQC